MKPSNPHCFLLRSNTMWQEELAKACAPQLGGIDPKVDATGSDCGEKLEVLCYGCYSSGVH